MNKLIINRKDKIKEIFENASIFNEARSEMPDSRMRMGLLYPRIIMVCISIMFQVSVVTGQSVQQPPNSSYLTEYGLSTKLFNAMINPMYQEYASFEGKLEFQSQDSSGVKSESYGVYYDPFYAYGFTLNLIVHDPEIYDDISRRSLKKKVGKLHEKFKKVRDKDLLNEDDVSLVSNDGSNVELAFSFKKSSLPKAYKYLHKWDGRIYMKNNELDRIELHLTEPDKIKGVETTEGSYVAYFLKATDGGYFLNEAIDSRKGTKKGKTYLRKESIDIGNYYDEKGELYSETKKDVSLVTAPGYKPDTLRVKLERSLPVLGNAARKAGYELPLPYGVDIFTHYQEETLGLEQIVLNGDDLTNDVLTPGGSSATAVINMLAARGDVWILPFLNVTLMTGYITGNTDVTLGLSDDVKDALGLIGLKSDNLVVKTIVSGPLVGAGITLAAGCKNFFATVNAMYINQFVQEANTEVNALAVTPLLGYRFPKIINVVVGAQYQIYDSKISGSINLEDENLNYEVNMKATHWNFIAGLQRDFSNHWNGTLMVGAQPRPQVTLVLGYRF